MLKNKDESSEFSLDFHPVLLDVADLINVNLLSVIAFMHPNIQSIVLNEESLKYLLGRMNKRFNIEINIENEKFHSKSSIIDYQNIFGRAVIIMTCELVRSSKYGGVQEVMASDLMRFISFMRNAATHYNKFNFKNEAGEWKIDEDTEIVWRHRKIERNLHEQEVFNQHFTMTDAFWIAQDISDLLKRIDQKKQ